MVGGSNSCVQIGAQTLPDFDASRVANGLEKDFISFSLLYVIYTGYVYMYE